MRRALGTALVLLAIAGRADAQQSDASAVAERLFEEARELARANRWAEACAGFEASLRSEWAIGAQLALAACNEHVGKLARAWRLYREVIDRADKAGDAKRRDYAQSHAAALEPRLARVSVALPVKPPAGLVVRWDDSAIDAPAAGAPLYADAGRHELVASAPGFEPFTRTVTLAEGQTAALAIPDLAEAAAAGAAEPAEASSATRVYAAAGLAGAGLVAAGVGLVFGAKASSKYGDAKAACSPENCDDSAHYERGKQLAREARSTATISTVLVAAGGAAVAAAAIVYLTRPRPRERTAARIAPVVHDRGAGLAVVGRF